jgi:AP endonuclease-2
VCAPIRAEEGITGVLCRPNSTTSFLDLPEDQQIGGYLSASQLSECGLDAETLDSEGRCVILEFPAFVLIGVYSPANRDETRDEFRIGFLTALDSRVRNLVSSGKRVFLTGDLNIIREELDTANGKERLRKSGMTVEEYFSTPSRRILNQMVVGGKVYGDKDAGREEPVMWDICRSFHPLRTGMFTCWEQKVNARPGNYGSRIDYVLCSTDWKDWFSESNIQEGLMGSDHCPVYAVIKDHVEFGGAETNIKDIMNPKGMFQDGKRLREWSLQDLLPTSAKLIPEFNKRRSIRDMFTKKPSLSRGASSLSTVTKEESEDGTVDQSVPAPTTPLPELGAEESPSRAPLAEPTVSAKIVTENASPKPPTTNTTNKRPLGGTDSARPSKWTKSGSTSKTAPITSKIQPGKGQSSLMGFFKPKTPAASDSGPSPVKTTNGTRTEARGQISPCSTSPLQLKQPGPASPIKSSEQRSENLSSAKPAPFDPADQESVIDPIVAKESWSKLLSKRVLPRCEHNEPCVSYQTKKAGINCGRSFYMCSRPLGPSGEKEKGTQWRCGTFVWSSDWTGDGT